MNYMLYRPMRTATDRWHPRTPVMLVHQGGGDVTPRKRGHLKLVRPY
jgi:hypothetical protein